MAMRRRPLRIKRRVGRYGAGCHDSDVEFELVRLLQVLVVPLCCNSPGTFEVVAGVAPEAGQRPLLWRVSGSVVGRHRAREQREEVQQAEVVGGRRCRRRAPAGSSF